MAKLYNDEDFDDTMRDFLESIETEMKDKWIIVMAGIIRGKLFRNDFGDVDTGNTEARDSLNGEHEQQDIVLESGRNKKTDTIIKKAVDGIILSLTEASSDSVEFRNEAEVALTTTDLSEEDERKMEKLLDSFHIGTDVKPDFVPWSYRLCSEAVISEVIPEMDERCDFIVNEEADILKVDERLDRKKAQEEDEDREEEQRRKQKALAEERKRQMNAKASSNIANMKQSHVKPRGIAGNASSGNGDASDTASLMMRSKKKEGLNGAPLGVGGRLGTNTAAGGRSRMSGLGRGAAANAIGGRSLANPMSRMRNPGGARGLMNLRRPGAVSGKTKNRMKMIDVSEVDELKKECEKRNQKLTTEEIRANKRRKIMEKASAKGLKSKKKWGHQKEENNAVNSSDDPSQNATTSNNTVQGINGNDSHNNAHFSQDNAVNQSSSVDPSFIAMMEPNQVNYDTSHDVSSSTLQQQQYNSALNLFNMEQSDYLNQQGASVTNSQMQQFQPMNLETQAHQMDTSLTTQSNHFENNQQSLHSQYQHQPSQQYQQHPAHIQSWQSLLVSSNKLSPDDRLRVEQFFTTNPRYNPTPNMNVYKMKLHESRTDDQLTNQTIKETLYLELDYGTGTYKLSRKKKARSL